MIGFKTYDITQTGQQITAIQILSNASRSKGRKTMKFGQLIEYSTRNIFLEKSYTKCDGEANPNPFIKNKI